MIRPLSAWRGSDASWAGTLVIDEADAALSAEVEAHGVRCVVASTVMSSPERAADLARVVVDAGV